MEYVKKKLQTHISRMKNFKTHKSKIIWMLRNTEIQAKKYTAVTPKYQSGLTFVASIFKG